jgi:hypothetical protein
MNARAAYSRHPAIKFCGCLITHNEWTDGPANNGVVRAVRVSLPQGGLVKSSINDEEPTLFVLLTPQGIARTH